MGALDFFRAMRDRQAAAVVTCHNQVVKSKSDSPAESADRLPAASQAAPAAGRSLAKLPADTRAKAAERLHFLHLVAIVKARNPRLPDPVAVATAAGQYAAELPILRTAGKKGSSALTYPNYRVWRAKAARAQTDADKLLALCDNYTSGVRPRQGDARFWSYFFAAYLNLNKLPITVAWRTAAAKMRAEDKTCSIPTLEQARYQVKQLPTDQLILAREGEEAFKNRCADYITRDWSEVVAGEVVVCDSRDFDTRVKVYDEAAGVWRARRPTIAGMMDARSWYLASYWITTEPVNCATLIDALALYCHNTGGRPPAVAYLDNGKDYNAAGFATPFVAGKHQHSIFKELNIKLVNSLPYNGRAKTVERFFRDMMQQFDKLFADYLGSRPGQRNQAADWYDRHPDDLPTLQQFCDRFAAWIDQYHRTPKHGKIHGGKSPAELWGARPDRPALSPEQLKAAFYKPEAVRTVQRGPAVTLGRQRYYCDQLHIDDKVLVKTCRLDSAMVMLYTLDGRLIGPAYTRDRIKALALDDDAARARIGEELARQRRQLKRAYTGICNLTGGLHQVSAYELFLAAPDANLIAVDTIRSVKGAAHSYTHHRLDFAEDRRDETLQAMGDTIAAAEPPAEPPAADPAELRAFDQFMIGRKPADRDDIF